MLNKLLVFTLLIIACFAIKQRSAHLKEESHELFGNLLFKPENPNNRTEQEVCEHYGGKMCTVFKIGTKCCKDGWFFKDTHCGGVGCEHDTLSITDMSWDY